MIWSPVPRAVSKPLEFPKYWECLSYSWWAFAAMILFMLMKWLKVEPQIVQGYGLTMQGRLTMWLSGWRFEILDFRSLISKKGSVAGDSLTRWMMLKQPCLCSKTPIKALDISVWLNFLVGDTHWCVGRVTCPEDMMGAF